MASLFQRFRMFQEVFDKYGKLSVLSGCQRWANVKIIIVFQIFKSGESKIMPNISFSV